MSTKLFEFSDLVANPLPDGGVPIFSPDLFQLQTNLMLYSAILTNYNCVLNGCLVYNINSITKKCSVSAGVIKINGIVYKTTEHTNIDYPFAFISGAETSDDRVFYSSAVYTVATDYTYSIKTDFVFDPLNDYPTNLTESMLYYDPFTVQHVEYILQATATPFKEVKNNLNVDAMKVLKDDKGNSITGGSISIFTNSGAMKWKHYGFKNFDDTSLNGLAKMKNYTNTSIGTNVGSATNTLIVNQNQIPRHTHQKGTLNIVSNGNHQHLQSFGIGDPNYVARTEFAQSEFGGATLTDYAGEHTHNITGETAENVSTQLPINFEPSSINVASKIWYGYSHSDIFNATQGYKFWTGNIKYNNM